MGTLNEIDRRNDEEHALDDRRASDLAFHLSAYLVNHKLTDAQRSAIRSLFRQQLAELTIKLSLFADAGAVRTSLTLVNPRYGARDLYPEIDEPEEAT